MEIKAHSSESKQAITNIHSSAAQNKCVWVYNSVECT